MELFLQSNTFISLTNKISDTDIVAKPTIIEQSASAKVNKVHKFSRGFSFLSDKNKNSFKLGNKIQRNICSETSWWQAAGTEPKHLIYQKHPPQSHWRHCRTGFFVLRPLIFIFMLQQEGRLHVCTELVTFKNYNVELQWFMFLKV